jgi:hypothetical protein
MASVAALIGVWTGAERIRVCGAVGYLGVCGAALAKGVERLAEGGGVAPVAAIPESGVEEVRGAEVVLEDDGELGDGEDAGGGAVSAGVGGEAAEAVTVDGLGDDGGATNGRGAVDFPLIGTEVEGLFCLAGGVWGDALLDLAGAVSAGVEFEFRLDAAGGENLGAGGVPKAAYGPDGGGGEVV